MDEKPKVEEKQEAEATQEQRKDEKKDGDLKVRTGVKAGQNVYSVVWGQA